MGLILKTLFEKPYEDNENREARMFDLARSDGGLPSDLDKDERQEIEVIRASLALIDEAWQANSQDVDRVQELFYEKLAAKHPGHPLLQNNAVRTLGDLFKASGDDVPELPTPTREALLQDLTPLQQLIEPGMRVELFGRAVRAAQVPKGAIVALMNWLNKSVSALVVLPDDSHQLVYTRRQSKQNPAKKDHADK